MTSRTIGGTRRLHWVWLQRGMLGSRRCLHYACDCGYEWTTPTHDQT